MEWILGRGVPQVAVFDTAFHSTLPPEAYVYGGSHEWLDKGIRRYRPAIADTTSRHLL
jgi:acetate kinase